MNLASQDLHLHLGELKAQLLHATDYERAFHYFLEEFGGDQKFITMGEVEPAPQLTPGLAPVRPPCFQWQSRHA